MPLYQNLDTHEVVELPALVGEHPVLGSRYVSYEPVPVEEADNVPVSMYPDAKPQVVLTPPSLPGDAGLDSKASK